MARKHFFMSIYGMNLHISRQKSVLDVTCFEEEESEYSASLLDRLPLARRIQNYLQQEGFAQTSDTIIVKFSPTEDENEDNLPF